MLFFFACVAILILGYYTYGVFVEKIFGPEPERQTPCWTKEDGVDYVNMPTWKVFFIQLLDIAGPWPDLRPDPRCPLRPASHALGGPRLDLCRWRA